MGGSNADKAWEMHVATAWDRPVNIWRETFMAGRASRDAEVAELTAAIQAVRDSTNMRWLLDENGTHKRLVGPWEEA